MKRKLLAVLLVGVLSMSFMVGCGEDTNVKSEESTTQSETIESDVTSEETEESSETETSETESDESSVVEESETESTEESTSTSVSESKDEPKESQTEESKSEPPHEHSYSSSVTKNPTCSESGVKTYQCSCGDSYTETIAKTGHSWNGGEYIQNGTCSSEAVKRFTCSVCGATEDKGTGEFGNHNFVEQQQTIHHEGSGHYETKRCITCYCGAKFYDASSFDNHEAETGHCNYSAGEESTWIVDSESWDEIITTYTCSICGAQQ